MRLTWLLTVVDYNALTCKLTGLSAPGESCPPQVPQVPEAVAGLMRTPEPLSVLEHTVRHRRVTDGAHTGGWNSKFAPHLDLIMEYFGRPEIREVWFCAPEQCGKTAVMLNCLSWALAQAPGDIFYLMATKSASDRFFSKKLIPLIKALETVDVTGRLADLAASGIQLANGVSIFPAWAGSPASMATFPARYCFADEIDKGDEQAGREADRVTLIRKRLRLYGKTGKAFFVSTPAQLFVYPGTMACGIVFVYKLLCQQCGEYVDPGENDLDLDKATLSCPSCHVPFSELSRIEAIRAGRWEVKAPPAQRPTSVGFHLTAFHAVDIPIKEIVSAKRKAVDGGYAAKVAWSNGYLAVDHNSGASEHTPMHIAQYVTQRESGVLPDDFSSLFFVVDTQQKGFHYALMAIGYGARPDITVVEYGSVPTFQHLLDLQDKPFKDASGEEYRAQVGWIDSGGGTDPLRPQHSRTAQVYGFCRDNRFWRPLKGNPRIAQPWQISKLDWVFVKGKGRVPIPGGLALYILQSNHWKDELAERLRLLPGEAGSIRLPAETDEYYMNQLCAEVRNEKGKWEQLSHKENHQWDILVYTLAAIDILMIRLIEKEQ